MLKEGSPTKLKNILRPLLCLGCLLPSRQKLPASLETLLSMQSKCRGEICSLSVSLAMTVNSVRQGTWPFLFTVVSPQVLAHTVYSIKVWRMNNWMDDPMDGNPVLWVWLCGVSVCACMYSPLEGSPSFPFPFLLSPLLSSSTWQFIDRFFFCIPRGLAQHLAHSCWWVQVVEWMVKFVGNADGSL